MNKIVTVSTNILCPVCIIFQLNCSQNQNDTLTGIGELLTSTSLESSTTFSQTSFLSTSSESDSESENENSCIIKRPILTLQLNDKEEYEELNLNISEDCIISNIAKGVTLAIEFQCEKEKFKIETWQSNALIFTTLEIGQFVNLNIFYYINPFENYKFINIKDADIATPILVFISAPSIPSIPNGFGSVYPKPNFYDPLQISEVFNCEYCYENENETNSFISPSCPCTNEHSVNFGLNLSMQNIINFGRLQDLDFYVQAANELNISKCEGGLPADSSASWIRFLGIKN